MSIEKSPLIRQQEERIAELQNQIKKKNTVIKSLKTRLSNMRDRVEDIQRKASQSYGKIQEMLFSKTKELRELITKLVKDKRFSKEDRESLKEILDNIDQEMPDADAIPGFDDFDPDFANEKARNHDPFADFKVAPEDDQQKDLRKLYLQLSKRFHPDRAKGEVEKKLYHEIQQRVIHAYQAHDLQAMVNLAMEHDLSLLDMAESETDVLEQRTQFLTRQLEGLEQQQERLSTEIKGLRKSNMGEMLTEVDSYARMGVDVTSAEGAMGPAIQQMDLLLNILKEVDRTGNVDLIEEMFASPYGDHYDPYGDDDDDFMSEMMDFFAAGVDENPNPTYAVGSWVNLYLSDQNGKRLTVRGQVTSAHLLEEEAVYDVELGMDSLEKLPEPFLRDMFYKESLGIFSDVPERGLDPAKAPSDTKIKSRATTIKLLWRRFAFENLATKSRRRIMNIVEANPNKSDTENWLNYLKRELKLPFQAIFEIVEEDKFGKEFLFSTELKVLKIFIDPNTDFIMAEAVDNKMVHDTCELALLHPIERKAKRIMEDYDEWYDAYLEWEGEKYGL